MAIKPWIDKEKARGSLPVPPRGGPDRARAADGTSAALAESIGHGKRKTVTLGATRWLDSEIRPHPCVGEQSHALCVLQMSPNGNPGDYHALGVWSGL